MKKLQEDIPNKIISQLGIIPNVYVENFKSCNVVVIEVEKNESAISYNGQFFVRVGSTTQVLKGKDLSRFLINKSGSNWDEYIVQEADESDIDISTIESFKKLAVERVPFIHEEMSLNLLLQKLNLLQGKKIKRAAILLFGKNPRKFFTSAFLRVGKFNEDGILLSSDTVEGNLFNQLNQTLELLKVKYLISNISIEGLYRKEKLEFPEEALREIIINALIHKDYVGAHVQLKIYPDSLSIWNEGNLLEPLDASSLISTHPSIPRNELLSDIFFKSGLIETWGQGTLKVIDECKKAGLPTPIFKEEFGGLSVFLSKDMYSEKLLNLTEGLNPRQKDAVRYLKDNMTISNAQYQHLFSVSKPTATLELGRLVKKDILTREGTRGAGTYYRLKNMGGGNHENNTRN